METMSKKIKEYRLAKFYFKYDKAVEASINEKGVVDEEKLNEILKAEYEKIISSLKNNSRTEARMLEKNVQFINNLYEFAINRHEMEYFENLHEQDKYAQENIPDENELLAWGKNISKVLYKPSSLQTELELKVSPIKEPTKSVKLQKIRMYIL